MESQISLKKSHYRKRDDVFSVQKIIFSLLGIVATLITIDFNAVPGYQFQFLLPFIYTIIYFIFAPPIKELGMGYLVLNAVWFIRYIINPIVIKLSGYSIRLNSIASDRSLNLALVLMLAELTITIITCAIFYKLLRKPTEDAENELAIKNINSTVILVLTGLTMMIFIFDRNAIFGFDFILNDEFTRTAVTRFGISISVLSWFKTMITVGLITKLGIKEQREESIYNLIFAFFLIALSMSFFSGTGRNGILIEALAYIYLLTTFFQKHKNKIFAFSIFAIFILLLTITLYRFYDTRTLTDSFEVFNIHVLSDMFNQYFGGQNNVAIGLRSIRLYGDQYNLLTLFRDSFVNTTIINRFVTDIPGTVEIFNSTLYNHTLWADQISPTITQSLGLFSVFGLFILPLLSYIILKMDQIAASSSHSFGIFLATFIAIKVAFFSPGNLTILMTAVSNEFIPLYILFKISAVKVVRERAINNLISKN